MSKHTNRKNYGPSNAKMPDTGEAWHFRRHRPVRAIGVKANFDTLSAVGRGKALNLMFGKQRTYRGDPIRGTGAASRISKPELLNRIAGLEKHRNVTMFERVR